MVKDRIDADELGVCVCNKQISYAISPLICFAVVGSLVASEAAMSRT